MSNQVYKDISGAAYGTDEEKRRVAEEHGLQLVRSQGEKSVFVDEARKEVIVSHRGTAKAKDITADLALAFGMEYAHPRFIRAMRQEKELERQYPGYDFVVTGHSLGGSLAQFVGGSKRVKKVVTFNKGSGLYEPMSKRRGKQTDYMNRYDPVSFTAQFQRGGKKVVSRRIAKGKGKHVHSIESSFN
jgi:hypothetical protein